MGSPLEVRVQQLEFDQRMMEKEITKLKYKQEEFTDEVGKLRGQVLTLLIKGGDLEGAQELFSLEKPSKQTHSSYGKSEHASETAPSSDKVESLGKIAKGMDELTKQVEELKSYMPSMEPFGVVQPQNNFVQPNDPPTYPPAYHSPNAGQGRNSSDFHKPRPYHQPNARPMNKSNE